MKFLPGEYETEIWGPALCKKQAKEACISPQGDLAESPRRLQTISETQNQNPVGKCRAWAMLWEGRSHALSPPHGSLPAWHPGKSKQGCCPNLPSLQWKSEIWERVKDTEVTGQSIAQLENVSKMSVPRHQVATKFACDPTDMNAHFMWIISMPAVSQDLHFKAMVRGSVGSTVHWITLHTPVRKRVIIVIIIEIWAQIQFHCGKMMFNHCFSTYVDTRYHLHWQGLPLQQAECCVQLTCLQIPTSAFLFPCRTWPRAHLKFTFDTCILTAETHVPFHLLKYVLQRRYIYFSCIHIFLMK